jgi:hypothetical protein
MRQRWAALGRDDIATVVEGDAEKFAALIGALQPGPPGGAPEIEGVAPALTLEERFTGSRWRPGRARRS